MKTQIFEFESKVKNTIDQYHLLNKKDKVLVCCSGGKDSTTVLYLLNKWGYNTEALILDLSIGKWSEENLKNLAEFCKEHKIKLNIISMREVFGQSICYIRSNIQSKTRLKNCLICGVIKRWLLNKHGRELGATKMVTGHNLDDEAENIMMNLCSGNPKLSIGLGPKNKESDDKRFVQRIKPLYFCTNKEIREYSEALDFPVLYDPCPCSVDSFRKHVRDGLEQIEKQNPGTKQSLVESFLKMLPHLRAAYTGPSEVKICIKCSEPARNEICKACELTEIMKTEKVI